MGVNALMEMGADQFYVRIEGPNIFFINAGDNTATTIEGIQLNKAGVIKEHPDLEDDPDWRRKSIERFKEHLKNMKNEDERIQYAIKELTSHGWKGVYLQKDGWRATAIREGR